MAELPELFKGLRINNYYKYLLYLAGIILILSLFIELKNVNVVRVRYVSFWIIVVGLGVWIFDEIMEKINLAVYEHHIQHNKSLKYYYSVAVFLYFTSIIIQVIVWAVTLIRLF